MAFTYLTNIPLEQARKDRDKAAREVAERAKKEGGGK